VTDGNASLLDELVAQGVERREARWLIEEFGSGPGIDARTALERAVTRRLAGEPLQYVIGHWPFRGLDLDVDPRVLIPRPETEGLVDVALGELARLDVAAPVILDLGCGSGAIGLSLLAELIDRGVRGTLICVDESVDALAVARHNALKHSLRTVSFVESSWFTALDPSLRGRIDLIVANPPYVGRGEFAKLDPVLSFEPAGALVSDDARGVVGFADLEFIITQASQWLTSTGTLICEHGANHRTPALSSAADALFTSIEDVDDLAGLPRVLVARR